MMLRLPAMATLAALSVAGCSERTPPATPESQKDAASASAPAGSAAQRAPTDPQAPAPGAAAPAPTADTRGHDNPNQAPQQPR
ncbi:hypothetical protein P7B02_03755 [Caulobacter segnis]|uniref:hypothetical protein n=1 Tax=Caulobacter segnis TaxID=88688 RepID=UPI0024101D3E|nr:hypothetical protein [Caulobacter segnis]MDG2520647.1 hypothetical protein [Caulobacter segnis]